MKNARAWAVFVVEKKWGTNRIKRVYNVGLGLEFEIYYVGFTFLLSIYMLTGGAPGKQTNVLVITRTFLKVHVTTINRFSL